MKAILKFIGFTLLSFIAFVVLYLLAAYIGMKITKNKQAHSSPDIAIYIKTNGAHTDVVVPVKTDRYDWSKEIKYANTIGKDSVMEYLSLGWGDRGFFLEIPDWSDLKFKIVFKAISGLGRTAMHATFYKSMSEDRDCRKIMISKQQYSDLVAFISKAFNKDADGHVILIPTNANYCRSDAFYEAKGSYHIFYTCNTWANEGLKVCGQKACLWTPFDFGIFSKYKQSKYH